MKFGVQMCLTRRSKRSEKITVENGAQGDMSRYIRNYCIGKEAEYAVMVTEDWLRESAATVLNAIAHYGLENGGERGPYTGPSGVLYSVVRAERALGVSHQKVTPSSLHVLPPSSSSSRFGSLLCGCVGDETVLAALGMNHRPLKGFLEEAVNVVCRQGNCNEVLYGKAGVLVAVEWIRQLSGTRPIPDAYTLKVIQSIITAGRSYASSINSPSPLLWEWHDTEYLGAAHGVAGILHSLLCHWDLLEEGERRDVKGTTEWLLSLEENGSGHWESSTGHVASSREKRLVHWCHGAPGMVGLWLLAHKVLGEQKYAQAAFRACSLIWQYGVLKKGPGLCHGVSGNAYCLLIMWQASKDEVWLQRAKCFAWMMMDTEVINKQRVPDSPSSLFEGWAGALSLLADLSEPETARFPVYSTPI